MRITSVVSRPREQTSLLSRDQAKLKSRSLLKLEICFGAPPETGCTKILGRPTFEVVYAIPFPSGVHWYVTNSPMLLGISSSLIGSPPSTGTIASFGFGLVGALVQ